MTTGPAELLAQTPIFGSLAQQYRDQLSGYFTRHEVPPNAEIVRQGEPADALFLIESGIVGVFVRDPRLQIVRLVNQLQAPESFGETALITGAPRTATVVALEPTVLYRLGRDVFESVIYKLPQVAIGVARSLAERLQKVTAEREIPWQSLATRQPDKRLLQSAPADVIRKYRVIPLELDKHFLTLGMVDPQDAAALQAARQTFSGVRFKIVAISTDDFERFMATLTPSAGKQSVAARPGEAVFVAPEQRPQITFMEDDDTRTTRGAVQQQMSGPQLIAIVDEIVGSALTIGASDIHVEHERKHVTVRYRVDGNLRPHKQQLSPEIGKPLVSRLKLLAKLDITETRRPQDGRISLMAGKRMVDLRISTMPAKFGEKIVLRILDAEANVADLKSLIVFEPVRQLFSEMIFRPHGLVLVTGPTGSGKTTTMYSALFARRKPELNVVTVEDPIEYHLDGVTQIQVQHDITSFASVLRAMLRQDPNVIMVGETRDQETAKMAVEASTTGHLVLTSMHTNSALEAVFRLLDLGVERYAIANSLVGVLHQRLVRKLCATCSEPSEYPANIMERLYRAGSFNPGEPIPPMRRAVGCARCGGTGYKGRVGVTELLVASDAVRNAFSCGAELSQLKPVARNGALFEMPRCAGALLSLGLTTPNDVLHLVAGIGT
ncbi:MAG TPA: ATPase, T2SS/T4P/T4SS family [Polyangiales bacterium]|jgi:type IV pilus assembly protein PilB|nr:ATPase, T2SS/T4P/T4SS family [Polyangiales bacterium]